jgi:hypothetical protein
MKVGLFEEKFRKEIWDRLEECEVLYGGLKWIAMMGLPISKDELKQYKKAKRNLVNKINKISKDLYKSIRTNSKKINWW